MFQPDRDLARITLGVLCIAGLIANTFWILGPFIPATIWAVTLVIATWPIMLRVQAHLWGRRGLAVLVMTIALLIIVVAPFWSAVSTIVANSDRIIGWGQALADFKIPPAPDWVAHLPMLGDKAAETWNAAATAGAGDLLAWASPHLGMISQRFASAAGSLGLLLVQLLLTVVVAAILFANGEAAAKVARRFGHRMAGPRGEQSVLLVGQAIRGVALGVVVTALVQSLIGGLALAIAGVPFAGILTAIMLMLCIVQVGPAPVLIAAVVWRYWSGETGWAAFLLVCSIIVVAMDNVLRPVLIRKGADLPLLLILAGVIGGLMAFGLIGIFVGPAGLAVTYTLMQAWLSDDGDGKAG